MMILVTYDVNITTEGGPKRLRDVARICKNYGQRVQNSVFECKVTPAQAVELEELLKIAMDEDLDSVRIYELGSNYRSKIKHFGTKKSLDFDGVLLF